MLATTVVCRPLMMMLLHVKSESIACLFTELKTLGERMSVFLNLCVYSGMLFKRDTGRTDMLVCSASLLKKNLQK